MSGARTGAPDSASTPRITTWWPSARMSAPSRASSSIVRNRPPKMFSVTIPTPSATHSIATTNG